MYVRLVALKLGHFKEHFKEDILSFIPYFDGFLLKIGWNRNIQSVRMTFVRKVTNSQKTVSASSNDLFYMCL